MSIDLFVNQVAGSLPSATVFWAISYFIIIRRNKLKVRAIVAVAYFVAPVAILGLLAWPIRSASYTEGIRLIVPFLLTTMSCILLYLQERGRRTHGAK